MTARHNIRIGNRRLGRERAAIDATPAPRVGEMLQNARERKGVDLFRAERDTKIRLKYLAALEDSDYGALPPLVYTKGFLRNYAIYLGLDPEDVLIKWRDETQVGRKVERPAVAPPPQPLTAPRRTIAITPSLFVAGLFSLVVIGVFVWIGWQLVRFADVPTISISSPAALVTNVPAGTETYLLAGVSGPHAEITITTPDSQRMTVVADENGSWSREVNLAAGRNDFTVYAIDAVTHRQSTPTNLIINVQLPLGSPGGTAAPTPAPMRLTLTSPSDRSTSADGLVTVSGTTNGTRVTIETSYLGADVPASPAPSGVPVFTPAPTPTLPGASPLPSGDPVAPAMRDLTVSTGSFSESLTIPPGRWQITVTASAAGVAPLAVTREVVVRPVAVTSLTVVFDATRGASWLRIIRDGAILHAGQWGGPILARGQSITVTAVSEIYVRTGNASALTVTVNGQPVELTGTVGNWIIRPGQPPEQTKERR